MLVEKLKEFLKDASFYGLSNVLGQLIGFFLIPLYTAYLTPDDYGVLTLLGFYTLFYTPFSHLGLHGAMFRYVGLASSESEKTIITSTALKVVIILSIFTTGISFMFLKSLETLFINSTDYTGLFILTIIAAFFSSLAQFAIAYLRIRRKVRVIFWMNIGNLVFSVTLNIILIVVLKLGLNGIVITNAIAALLFFLSVFIVSKVPYAFKIKWILLKQMLLYGIPNVPSHIQGVLMIIFSQVYLSKVISATELGLYAVAWKFCLPFQAVIGIVHSTWSAYKFEIARNTDASKELMRQFILLMSLFYVFVYLAISSFGPSVLLLMVDPEYARASLLIPVLSLIPLANGYYFFLTTGIAFGRRQYLMPLISFAGVATTVSIAILVVRDFGAVGAAIATTAGWVIMSIGAYKYSLHNYGLTLNIWIILLGFVLCVLCMVIYLFTTPSFLTSFSFFTILLFGVILSRKIFMKKYLHALLKF